jgi:uncharacterized delta-60 repeat protein
VVLQPDGKIVAGGLNQLVRLNSDGSVDTTFDGGTGPNGEVLSMALQPDGGIILGGTFTEFNGVPRPYLARVLATGALDSTFAPPGGPDEWVKAILVQPDGRIVIGGAFTQMNGAPHSHLARLTKSGDLDPYFYQDAGADSWILALVRRSNGWLVTGGDFSQVNGIPRSGLAQIGSVDMAFTRAPSMSNGVVTLTLLGQAGFDYLLESTDDLETWSLVSTGRMVVTAFTAKDPNSTNHSHRAYRLQSR